MRKIEIKIIDYNFLHHKCPPHLRKTSRSFSIHTFLQLLSLSVSTILSLFMSTLFCAIPPWVFYYFFCSILCSLCYCGACSGPFSVMPERCLFTGDFSQSKATTENDAIVCFAIASSLKGNFSLITQMPSLFDLPAMRAQHGSSLPLDF